MTWHNIVNWLNKSPYDKVLSARLDPQSEAMRHKLRADAAAVQRLIRIHQRTALMEDIIGRKRDN